MSVHVEPKDDVCVLIGHSIEAITSAVVLASLGQHVHLYADRERLAKQIQQYGFEHHLQALWQLYVQQQRIIHCALPDSMELLLKCYESLSADKQTTAALYWLFLDSVTWSDTSWITAFNHNCQQACPIIMSDTRPLGQIASLAARLQRAWVYYVPFVFLQDGETYSSMLTPRLWLLGEKTPDSHEQLRALQPVMEHAHIAHYADIATIEFARSSIIAMLATRVSFMNEMSRLADSQHVDIGQVSKIMGLDARVGSSYLQAGWGFGGQTLPAELSNLKQSSMDSRVEMPLLNSVMTINEDQKELIFRKFWQYFDGFIDNKTVMIWGGSYKMGSGLTAGSAIHPLLSLLWSYNITTKVYSAKAKAELTQMYGTQPLLELVDDPYESLSGAQALFIMSWPLPQRLNTQQLNQIALPIFDAQNALSRAQVTALVGDYIGIGRGK